jgi:hypothetical protein
LGGVYDSVYRVIGIIQKIDICLDNSYILYFPYYHTATSLQIYLTISLEYVIASE